MKVNYVLMYGTPFLKLKHFENFDDISKYLVNHSIVDYNIYEKMDGTKEVEMICLQSDVRVLEKRIEKVVEDLEKTKEINGKSRENSLINLDIDHINYLINILRGEENE